jgi:hypothetical protein
VKLAQVDDCGAPFDFFIIGRLSRIRIHKSPHRRYIFIQKLGLAASTVLNLAEVMAFDCFGNYISPVVAHLSGTHSSPWVASNCILNNTGSGCHSTGANPWLMVDFGTYVPISRVVILNRADCCQDRISKYPLLTLAIVWSSNWVLSRVLCMRCR